MRWQKKAKSEGLTAEETAERDKASPHLYRFRKGQPDRPAGQHLYPPARRQQDKIAEKTLRLHANVQLLSDFLIGIQGDFPEISEKESFLWKNYGT